MRMREIPFFKMQGCGNDFVVLNNWNGTFDLDFIIKNASKISDRRFGIGADGIILIEKSDQADFTMIYRNADGSDAGMCGNGGRCAARFAFEKLFPRRIQLSFIVHGNIYHAEKIDKEIKLHFPFSPKIEPKAHPKAPNLLFAYPGTEHLMMVNPPIPSSDTSALFVLGKLLRHDTSLSERGANMNFIYTEANRIYLKTFERGVEDFTLACGTGTIASAMAVHYSTSRYLGAHSYDIEVDGGRLRIGFDYSEIETYENISLQGAAEFVFRGSIEF